MSPALELLEPTRLLAEAMAVAGLLALLVVAYRHPRRRVEAGVSVVAIALALASGLLPLDDVRRTVVDLAPVVAFLATILVVSEVCDRAGLFTAAGRLLRRRDDGPRRLLGVAFLMAAAVTAVLSLDATVVLLTPVVLAAARSMGTSARPGAYACLRMANSASLLLPVSNLTNLLALPYLGLTFAGFAATMAPVLVVVLLVEYAALRVLFARDLAHAPTGPSTGTAPAPAPAPADTAVPRVPIAVVGAMLAGFAITSPLGVEPCWVSGAAALVLVAWARSRDLLTLPEAARATHAEFVLFVLALGVVVAAISVGFLGDLVGHLVPRTDDLGALLVIALLATVLANTLTNLSATLLLVPLVAPLGDTAVLAALLGLNIGSGLTFTGSLANLLWRRTLTSYDERPGLAGFHRVSLVATPLSLLAAVLTLALVT